ncbi:HlyD family efflux transporter periplasmic adaptor subunit [Planktothrix agardhii 1029]|uniref:efflux RND transporter periplasmic adaptor subunit n=1 Tax=Planktothrix agardhii TaxID=1160 RepID=UPI001D0A9592|nr:HlyD family efflux transporter periplasmic adaptor subunit [Planktothrix agardhii]MCB8784345.1 HlyD family efflux transporter periplasmic adaptor subunit [Planktothrix agardhii 1808]MCB8766919.1 HlyD family efflux transporter periplasmic adaptor subunit [Planktothrix agardhii 1809]MCB8779919.1 HlyD family efflux transporter periplasmic adaptor subunit [Planktothrix agardhii 1031]MCF3564633.1 HlyD family efflux transporter periplasmic adaptor subunit [Planktothrix agardhii 1807]MCF3587993.1 
MSSLDYQAKRAYQRGVKWLIIATLFTGVSLVGVALYYKLQKNEAEAVAAGLQKVELGTVENKISEGGTVELGGQRTIKSPTESAVDQIFVQVGDPITKGQNLIQLRSTAGENSLLQKQLEIQKQELAIERNRQKVEEAQNKLKIAKITYKNGLEKYQQQVKSKQISQRIEIQKNQAQLERQQQKVIEAQEDLTVAEAELNKSNNLLEKGFIPATELDGKKADIRLKEASLKNEQLALNNAILDLETSKNKFEPITDPTNDILAAKNELLTTQSELQQSLSDFQKLKVEYKEQKSQLKNNLVTSPLEGVVLNINVKPKDGIKLGDDLITIGDPDQELVQLQLSTLNAAQVKPNQSARITIIGPNSKPFQGRVEWVNLQATPEKSQSGSSSGQPTVPATVRLDQPTRVLIPGGQVSVEIILEQQKDVIAINTELIQSEGKSSFVWKLDANNQVQKQPVTLGLKDLTKVEIKSGLKVGDTLVIPPTDIPLKPGMVIIEEEKDKNSDSES